MANATATLPSLPNVTACQPYQPKGPTYGLEYLIHSGAWYAAVPILRHSERNISISAEVMAPCCGTNPLQLFAQTCELFCAVPEHKYPDITHSDGFSQCLEDNNNGTGVDLKYGQGKARDGGDGGGDKSSPAAARAAVGGWGLLVCLGLLAVGV